VTRLLLIDDDIDLCRMLAEYLAASYQAEVVIIGRRAPELTELTRRHLRDLGASAVHYHQVDLTDGPALQHALDRHDVINGVVHSALALDDSMLATMTESVLFDVLRPKLHGTHNLLRALRGRDIEFCLFFSSVQSYLANAGQANYTAACVAKDAYADLMRNALLINSKVVNWGYWGSIGIVAKPRCAVKRLQRPSHGLKYAVAASQFDLLPVFVFQGHPHVPPARHQIR
jgi:polyketide synthase PksM